MFPFWYGHYPYQVAEYDECPVSDPRDLPQPLILQVAEERWSKRSVMWRPWFSTGRDLFSFFQVDVLTHFVLIETMVVGEGKLSLSKKPERVLWALTDKILKLLM